MEIVAYGDAFGLPYETQTKQELRNLRLLVSALIEPWAHSDFADFQGTPVGTWSDDTQHALVVSESLEHIGTYSLFDIAQRLKTEMEQCARGWGGATKHSISRVHELMSTGELRKNGDTEGRGCGPLMRSLPLVVYCMARCPEELDNIARESTTLTHNNPDNIACTVTHHQILAALIRGDADDIAQTAYELAIQNERSFGAKPYLSEALKRGMGSDDLARDVYGDNVDKMVAFSSWSVQAMSYLVFAKYKDQPLIDLLVAVVTEGGDADSTASIVAGMWAITRSEGVMPEDIDELQDSERLKNASKYICSLMNKSE